jgi:hypothetical protein
MNEIVALILMVTGIIVFIVAMWCIHWLLGLIVTALAAIRLGYVMANP